LKDGLFSGDNCLGIEKCQLFTIYGIPFKTKHLKFVDLIRAYF